ncbi:hypothetical protein OsI_06194 [Oryza sativa Indica Group]|uniref:Uncharacterized protein n=1 Tax=Oryza sativa subsp. indica TaxID=39946 RepID=B8AJ98_ORYSI|nr:hypothetical protein OsI_06194 [Oryza sativa Indica Group]
MCARKAQKASSEATTKSCDQVRWWTWRPRGAESQRWHGSLGHAKVASSQHRFDGGREGHAERSRKGGTARARSCKGGDGSMVDTEATRSGVEGWHGSPGHAKVVTPRRRRHDLGLEK